MTAQTWIMLGGAALVLVGILIRWRVARYDLKDAAIESAWSLARGQRSADNPTALEARFHEIRDQPTWGGRARKTAGTVAGHFIAQVMTVVSLVMILGGVVLIVAAYIWR